MTSIVFGIVGVFNSLLKWNYLQNKKTFSEVFVSLMESSSNFKHFRKKKWSLYLMYFRNYRLSKIWLNHSLESDISEPPSTFDMLMGDRHVWKLHESSFIIFFDHSEGKKFAKYLPYWIWNLRRVFEHIDCRWEVSFQDCENLHFPIQKQLS